MIVLVARVFLAQYECVCMWSLAEGGGLQCVVVVVDVAQLLTRARDGQKWKQDGVGKTILGLGSSGGCLLLAATGCVCLRALLCGYTTTCECRVRLSEYYDVSTYHCRERSVLLTLSS